MHTRLTVALLAAGALAACAEDPAEETELNTSPVLGDAQTPYNGSASFDAYVPYVPLGTPDATTVTYDASFTADASSRADASSTADASVPDANAQGDAGSVPNGNLCPGSATPHGCYKAKAGNDPKCPAQIFEQSAFYPPMNEWKGCESPWYQACNYVRPDGTDANCSCDFGLHWLCTY